MTFNDIFNTIINAIRPPIGAFNELVFEVSTEKVITYDDYKRDTKARYARHELINQTSVLEYLGRDLEEITFTMMFTVSLGVDPAEETSKLRRMCLDGVADYLILGNTVVGENLWTIESVGEAKKAVDHFGKTIVSSVNVKMVEYVPAVMET